MSWQESWDRADQKDVVYLHIKQGLGAVACDTHKYVPSTVCHLASVAIPLLYMVLDHCPSPVFQMKACPQVKFTCGRQTVCACY